MGKLPNKQIVFIEVPDSASWFLDYNEDGEFYVRIEGMDIRYVFPIGPRVSSLEYLADEVNKNL